jgi:hypothetical protein
LAALLVADLAQPLKVVVEHSRMADQTHPFGSFVVAGSDHCAAPRANNFISGFRVHGLVIASIIYVATHAQLDRQISFQLPRAPRHQ